VHYNPRETVPHARVQRVPDVDKEPVLVFPLDSPEAEELPGDVEDRLVELPAVDNDVGIEVEEGAGDRASAEAEDGDGAGREDGREGGEDVEVGVGEWSVGECDAVDVAGSIEEEEPRAAERMVGFSRNF
ncbi:hypothetical protein PIB30_105084, partial [Stylosanthes scabra]|nr:hypothetical protein [Stylosanthes scabra]